MEDSCEMGGGFLNLSNYLLSLSCDPEMSVKSAFKMLKRPLNALLPFSMKTVKLSSPVQRRDNGRIVKKVLD